MQGYYYDRKTQFYYLQARYSDPRPERFISEDTYEGEIDEPITLNQYAYAVNNPMMYVDPTGFESATVTLRIDPFDGKKPDFHEIIDFYFMDSYNILMDPKASNLKKTVAALELIPQVKSAKIITKAGKKIVKATTKDKVSKDSRKKIVDAFKKNYNNKKDKNKGWVKPGQKPYKHLKDPPNVGSGKDFTAAQKQKIVAENMKKNGGVVRSDQSGEILVKPSKSQKGVTPPQNEWQIDHITPKSKGGSNSYSNAKVLSRKENREKWDK